MATMRVLPVHIVPARKKHTATVFFFHGSGDTAENMKSSIDTANKMPLDFPHIKLIYPTAPKQPYTAANGMMQHIWFDRFAISNTVAECRESIDIMGHDMSYMIDQEEADGISLNRIVLGGYSMGGCFALHLAYRYKAIAGCFTMSSFLNKQSAVYEHLETDPENKKIPLIQFHGSNDPLIPLAWGQDTAQKLKGFGVNVQFIETPSDRHELTDSAVRDWVDWLYKILPIREY